MGPGRRHSEPRSEALWIHPPPERPRSSVRMRAKSQLRPGSEAGYMDMVRPCNQTFILTLAGKRLIRRGRGLGTPGPVPGGGLSPCPPLAAAPEPRLWHGSACRLPSRHRDEHSAHDDCRASRQEPTGEVLARTGKRDGRGCRRRRLHDDERRPGRHCHRSRRISGHCRGLSWSAAGEFFARDPVSVSVQAFWVTGVGLEVRLSLLLEAEVGKAIDPTTHAVVSNR